MLEYVNVIITAMTVIHNKFLVVNCIDRKFYNGNMESICLFLFIQKEWVKLVRCRGDFYSIWGDDCV